MSFALNLNNNLYDTLNVYKHKTVSLLDSNSYSCFDPILVFSYNHEYQINTGFGNYIHVRVFWSSISKRSENKQKICYDYYDQYYELKGEMKSAYFPFPWSKCQQRYRTDKELHTKTLTSCGVWDTFNDLDIAPLFLIIQRNVYYITQGTIYRKVPKIKPCAYRYTVKFRM